MEGSGYVDIFATKGIEYLLVIGYLIAFIIFWRLLARSKRSTEINLSPGRVKGVLNEWFNIPEGYFYHQGHSWVQPQDSSLVKIGIDDFAQKFIGIPENVITPAIGTKLEQGNVGLQVKINSKTIDLLSPVDGKVVSVNDKVVKAPGLLHKDPYGEGWLMKVEVPKLKVNLRNLLSGKMVTAWKNDFTNKLRDKISLQGELGMVMQDGGYPVPGFVRYLSKDNWEDVAKEFLLTK